MINARVPFVFSGRKDMDDGGSKVGSIGGSATLVEDDIEPLARLHQGKHRLDKVFAKSGIQPCRAENKIVASCFDDALLAMEFGQAIDSSGSLHGRGGYTALPRRRSR